MQNEDWLRTTNIALPPDLEKLPTITAEHWICIDRDPTLFLEGPAFDRDGNLYVCCSVPVEEVTPRVYKVTPEGIVSILCYLEGFHAMGMAIHKDGRLFTAGLSNGFVILSSTGEVLKQWAPQDNGRVLAPNDLVFDANGDLYFTDFSGTPANPCGGVYRLRAASDYCSAELVAGGMIFPNGLAFTADMRRLWVGESGRNVIWQLELGPDRNLASLGVPVTCVYKSSGTANLDGCRMDGEDYYYQALNRGGRIIVLNAAGIPVGNVVVPKRTTGQYDMTPNLAIRPGTNEAYMLASGTAGVHIFRFPTKAIAPVLYSHM